MRGFQLKMLRITAIYHNISPTEFRKGKYSECVHNPFYQDKLVRFQSFEEYDKQIHTTIQGGKFAVYRFDGQVQDIFAVFQGLFNVWLANSGYEIDERYELDIYRAINWENMHVVMDLCIPIK